MEFIKQALIKNGIITSDGYIDDALLSNRACVCDRHGRVTHRLSYAANGVDILCTDMRGNIACRICL